MKHEKEIKRWADCPDGTIVWFRLKDDKGWKRAVIPYWDENTLYVVDDKWAEIAKQFIDDKSKVEFTSGGGKYCSTDAGDVHILRRGYIDRYRIKSDEPTYYYKREKLYPEGRIVTSEYLTDERANYNGCRVSDGWRRIDSSKRTWK